MNTSIDTATLYVVQGDNGFGIRQGNPGEDAPEGYVSRSALKAVIRATLDAQGGPVVVSPEVASAAGRENLQLMTAANKAGMAAGLIGMASGLIAEASAVFQADVSVDAVIADINAARGESSEDESEDEDEPADF